MKMPLRLAAVTASLALIAAGCANRSAYYTPGPEPLPQPAQAVQQPAPVVQQPDLAQVAQPTPPTPTPPPAPQVEPGLTEIAAEELPPDLAEWAAIQKQEGAREPQVRSKYDKGVLYIAVSGGAREKPGYTASRRRSHTREFEAGTLLVLDVAITPPKEGAPAEGSRMPQAFFKWTGGQYFTLNWIDESHWAEKPALPDVALTAALRWETAMYAYLQVHGTTTAPEVEVALYDGAKRLAGVGAGVVNGRFMIGLGHKLPQPGHTVMVTAPGSEPLRLMVPERLAGAHSNTAFPVFSARIPSRRTVEVTGQSDTAESVSLVVMVNGQEAARKDGLKLSGPFRENIAVPADLPIDGVEVWTYVGGQLVLVADNVYHGK